MSDHFFKSVKIENFRGIKSLEISDLARVNLFVGKNGCGKTSVLESVFLLIGISNPNLIVDRQNARGIGLLESSDIRDFFYNRHHEKGLVLSCVQARGGRNLEILPLYGNLKMRQAGVILPGGVQAGANPAMLPGNGDLENLSFGTGAAATGQTLVGLGYQFLPFVDGGAGQDKPYEAGVYLTKIGNPETTSFSESAYKESLKGVYLGKTGYNSEFVDQMLNEKKKDLLLPSIQSLDDKITDIRTGARGLVSVDTGLDSFIPIGLLGDGVVRVLNIASGISAVPNGALMIDEIENGLHVTALEQVWEVVLDWSGKYNAQIFITTHSGDVINSLRRVLDENMFPDSVACYRLVKSAEDETRAYRYSSEQLEQALDVDTDIRL
ncbi:MAG: AAA family ATPase [Gammaproteobacteria bacterium]|nr:AAA family ATPase [Gammaproteobacteria bacterium]